MHYDLSKFNKLKQLLGFPLAYWWESRGPGWWASGSRSPQWQLGTGSRLSGSLCFSISLVLPSGELLTLSVTLLFFFLWSCCWFQCSEESRGLYCWPLGRMTQSCISDMFMWISCLSPKNTHLDSFMWTWIIREGSANTSCPDKADHAFCK